MISQNQHQWSEIRLKGKRTFLWWNGVVLRGLPMALAITFFDCFFRKIEINSGVLIGNLVGGIVFGLLYGGWLWRRNEAAYTNHFH